MCLSATTVKLKCCDVIRRQYVNSLRGFLQQSENCTLFFFFLPKTTWLHLFLSAAAHQPALKIFGPSHYRLIVRLFEHHCVETILWQSLTQIYESMSNRVHFHLSLVRELDTTPRLPYQKSGWGRMKYLTFAKENINIFLWWSSAGCHVHQRNIETLTVCLDDTESNVPTELFDVHSLC